VAADRAAVLAVGVALARPAAEPLHLRREAGAAKPPGEFRRVGRSVPWQALARWSAHASAKGSECQVSKLVNSDACPRPTACAAGQPVGHRTTSLGGRARMGSVRSAKFLHRFYIVSTTFLRHFYIVSTTWLFQAVSAQRFAVSSCFKLFQAVSE
jgi:hypothetical protein